MKPSSEEQFQATRSATGGWFARAQQAVGGALGHDMRHALPFPTYIERAQGAYKWDVDGHRYIDYHMGNGALLLGHAHPAIVEAVIKAAPLGTHFGNDHPLQVEWAEKIQSLVPCGSGCASRTRARSPTCWLPRRARPHGRPTILRFEGHFHGWGDELVTGFAPPFDVPPSIGLAPGFRLGTVMTRPMTSTRWTGSSASGRRRRGHPRAERRLVGSAPAPARVPGRPPRGDPPPRDPPHLRRGHHRLPLGARRRPGAVRRHARPLHPREDHRRRRARARRSAGGPR